MEVPLEGALRKVSHAHKHLNLLNQEIVRFLRDPQPYEIISEKDADGWQSARIRLKSAPPAHLSLIAGDAIHNARAALDHAIFDLSGLPASDREGRKRLQFLLYTNRGDYLDSKKRGRWDRALASVDAKYRAVVDRSQPFKRGNSLLGALADFDNTNKHRLLHAGVLSFASLPTAKVTYGGLPGLRFRSWPTGKRLKDGAEVWAFTHRRATTKHVGVDVRFEPTVAFGSRNLTTERLREMTNRVAAILVELSELKAGRNLRLQEVQVPGGTAWALIPN